MIFNIKDEAMTSRFYKTWGYSNKKGLLLLPGIHYVDPSSSSPEPRVCVCVSVSAQSAKLGEERKLGTLMLDDTNS